MLRTVRNESDLSLLLTFLRKRKRPFSVEVTDGRRRSTDQNRLSHLWFKEIAEQLGDRTPEDVRAHCKLVHGVPILRAENEAFRERYDAIVRPLPYEAKIALMAEPLDMPVSRLMSVDQLSRWLNAVEQEFTKIGVALTAPEDRRAA